MSVKPVVLTIAGHDPCGGAGIQADIETLGALGCHPASVVTSLTVQDSRNVHRLSPVDPDMIYQQAAAVLEDFPVALIKIGLIGSAGACDTICRLLDRYPQLPVVLDPVLAAGGGSELASHDLLEAITTQLLPRTTLITPNSPEARKLTNQEALEQAANRLLELGCQGVLITGAHEADRQVINTLYQTNLPPVSNRWPRLPASYHGSGCTLASAISAYLAQGTELETAVLAAQRFTWNALNAGWQPGSGQHLPNRLYRLPLTGEPL